MISVTRLGRLWMTVIAMMVGPVSAMEKDRVIYKDSTGALKHFYNLETGDNRLMWYPQVGEKELVCDYGPDDGLAMGVFYREGDEIAGVTGRPHGELVYHLYTRTANGWKETSSSPMGGGGGLWDMKMTGTRRMLAEDSQENPLELVVTDIPLFPDSTNTLDKLILLNGQPFKPRGLGTGMAIWDQPLEKILADHEARLKAAKTKEPQKSAAEPTGKTPASEKAGEAVGK
ncbi:MAG TPA: hypothetical protein DCP71_06395 [Verrucomicrobiales bacterium]|nr:hypothetical protein [Verrucomicrobiales bacterium]